MKKWFFFLAIGLFVFFLNNASFAHFGMVIPSDTMVMQDDNKTITITLSFSHPFEGEGMELVKPATFAVATGGKKTDLLVKLKETQAMGHRAWKVEYKINRPGVYTVFMEPKPYWEPAEDCFIVHYTKVVVNSLGVEEGWDQEVGLKTEIVPLTRPYGLWTGNVFQGIVKVNGKPAAGTEVEVE